MHPGLLFTLKFWWKTCNAHKNKSAWVWTITGNAIFWESNWTKTKNKTFNPIIEYSVIVLHPYVVFRQIVKVHGPLLLFTSRRRRRRWWEACWRAGRRRRREIIMMDRCRCYSTAMSMSLSTWRPFYCSAPFLSVWFSVCLSVSLHIALCKCLYSASSFSVSCVPFVKSPCPRKSRTRYIAW